MRVEIGILVLKVETLHRCIKGIQGVINYSTLPRDTQAKRLKPCFNRVQGAAPCFRASINAVGYVFSTFLGWKGSVVGR